MAHRPTRRSRLDLPAIICAAPILLALSAAGGGAADASAARPVWIDADPACFVPRTADVDDCWALLLALDAPELRVVGVGTGFGNVDGMTAYRSAAALLTRWSRARGRPAPPLYRGALTPGDGPTDASRSLAAALAREPLSILALGPLTNVARTLHDRPALAGRVREVVAVMGRRPGEVFLVGGPALHVHDLNLIKDPVAARIVLSSGVTVTLAPFAAGRWVVLDDGALERLAARSAPVGALARASAGWAGVWRRWLDGGGMPLFDAAAIAAIVAPHHLDCRAEAARVVRRRALFSSGRWYLHVVPAASGDGWRPVRYCARARPLLQGWVMSRLAAMPPRAAR